MTNEANGPSLHDELAALGIRHEKTSALRNTTKRALFDASGVHLGDFDVTEGWAALPDLKARFAAVSL